MSTETRDHQTGSPIDFSTLEQLAKSHRDEYLTAYPWPHVVLTDLIDPTFIAEAERQELRRALDLEVQMGRRIIKAESPEVDGHAAKDILDALRSPPFVAFLEQLTGIDALLPDPTHHWGGLHASPPGAFQALHRDFRVHPVTGLFHRVNVLVFLNSDWKPEYGGHLELWPKDTKACGRQVLPVAGTVMIFETTVSSFHGVPDPVRCPPGRARLSLASYYYTEVPGEKYMKEPRFFVPKRPQDPWYMGVGGFNDTLKSIWKIIRRVPQ